MRKSPSANRGLGDLCYTVVAQSRPTLADMLSPYIVVNTLTPNGVGVFF